jgi:PIN domain nuclease of toxin-antitoxin system
VTTTPALLADTQVLIWYVLEPTRLSDPARAALEAAVDSQEPIRVSAWSLVEIGYAVEKSSNPLTEGDRDAILSVLSDPESPFEVVPVDASIAAHTHQSRERRTLTPATE